ncbi:MAG: sulfatase [Planctomycetes bacterium]|nr:sulfatase [Planctomycetota bacterium]
MLRCILVGLLAVLVLPFTANAQEKKKKQPNIIFIMSDDHANAAIGAYGSWLKPVVKTPNLDKLAKKGMRFTSSMVTNSICTPSRAAILTSQYSHKNGVYTLNDALPKSTTHIGHLLRLAGYQTALIGKWHLMIDPTGFDYWNVLPGQGVYINPKLRPIGAGPKELKEYKDGYSEDVITDLSIDWLKKRDKDKPFYLMCHFKAPHRPWDPAPRFKDLYKGVKIPEPETLYDDFKGRSKQVANIKMRIGNDFTDRDLQTPIGMMDNKDLRAWAYQEYLKRYLSCVAAVDENVGRLLAFLEAEGLSEDTIIVYTSDQGFFLGEHGFYDKRLMYEPALLTPLIVHWPGHTKAGAVNNDIVLNLDHAPTFLDVAGAPMIPKSMQGRSLKAVLEGKTPADWRQSMYYRYWMHLDGSHNVPAHYGIRTTRYTLIHFYGKHLDMKGAKKMDLEPEWELYDNQKDPQQLRNVYADPVYAPALRELRMEMDRLRREVGDDK